MSSSRTSPSLTRQKENQQSNAYRENFPTTPPCLSLTDLFNATKNPGPQWRFLRVAIAFRRDNGAGCFVGVTSVRGTRSSSSLNRCARLPADQEVGKYHLLQCTTYWSQLCSMVICVSACLSLNIKSSYGV